MCAGRRAGWRRRRHNFSRLGHASSHEEARQGSCRPHRIPRNSAISVPLEASFISGTHGVGSHSSTHFVRNLRRLCGLRRPRRADRVSSRVPLGRVQGRSRTCRVALRTARSASPSTMFRRRSASTPAAQTEAPLVRHALLPKRLLMLRVCATMLRPCMMLMLLPVLLSMLRLLSTRAARRATGA